MPTTLTNGIQLPDKGSVDWYSSMQSNYNLIDAHLGNTDIHVTTEDKANWDSKANASHTHTSSELTDIGDYATKQYVDTSISGLVDNAPDALNTLNELSAALNDDANFASTVTTALGAKADSADLATVATSGSYTDLTDKPTINDSTITIQKNGSTVDTFTTNGSAKTINIPVPTKTSDLTNDSNFVDTSNSAVASGITASRVTSYDGHIADTDIHVTSANKTKWNNNVNQSYVLRYSSTAITDNSTIAYSTLDNTDNIKSSDKIIDSDGKIFSIVSVDTANETVTVGSALIDLALDANVMHLSGNETATGNKNFEGLLTTIPGSTLWPAVSNTSDDIKLLGNHVVHVEQLSSGKLTDLSGGAWNVVELGLGCFFFRYNSGTDIRYKQLNTGDINRIPVVSGSNRFIHDVTPNQDNTYKLGSSSLRWRSINNINPGALGMPDLDNGLDISGYITDLTGASNINNYTPTVNGWISIGLSNADFIELYIPSSLMGGTFTKSINNYAQAFMPVVANKEVRIALKGSSIGWAKFYPNLGNV